MQRQPHVGSVNHADQPCNDFMRSGRIERGWRVSRPAPCEWCGGTKYCLRFPDGGSFCRTIGDVQQWTDAFLGGYLHRPQDGAPSRSVRRYQPEPAPACGDPDTLDRVYRALRRAYLVSDDHRALLKEQGLSDDEIALCATLPADADARRAGVQAIVDEVGTAACHFQR